jgi:hypothetical protein
MLMKKGNNQKSSIEERQTIQWTKENKLNCLSSISKYTLLKVEML